MSFSPKITVHIISYIELIKFYFLNNCYTVKKKSKSSDKNNNCAIQ